MGFVAIAVSVSACVYFWLVSDMHKGWKTLASLAVLASLATQCTALGESVPGIVPLLIEIVVGIWGLIYIKMDQA